MKIALCLHGLVGSITGKHCSLLGGSDEVLRKSYEHNKKLLLDKDIDVFVHSWSTECTNDILSLYNPKKCVIEPQIQFEVPDYIKSDYKRAFAHLSRWYSFKKAVELKTSYESGMNFTYDLVLVQRFDLCWNVSIDFNTFSPLKLTVGTGPHLNTSREWQDQWFIANSENINKLASLYDMIPVYMGPDGAFTSNKQYAGISSHFLVRHHALNLGLDPEFKYSYGYRGSKNDYTEVRRQYYGEDL